MDSREHGASSSSPNVNPPALQEIVIPEDSSEEGHVLTSDGSSYFIPVPLLNEKQLSPGDPLSPSLLDWLQRHSLKRRCLHKSIDLLARREHSCLELQNKLKTRGYPPEVIRPVIDELVERDYLSDERFTEEWLRVQLRKGNSGPLLLRAKLQQKGIDDGLIEKGLAEMYPPEDQGAVLQRLMKDAEKRYGGNKSRIFRYLQNKGFPLGQVYEKFNEISEDSC